MTFRSTLQTVPASPTPERDDPWLAKAAGFSLHAGVAAGAQQRDKVERLCRYITRPPIATGRLALTGQGDIR
jgi:Putative transposase